MKLFYEEDDCGVPKSFACPLPCSGSCSCFLRAWAASLCWFSNLGQTIFLKKIITKNWKATIIEKHLINNNKHSEIIFKRMMNLGILNSIYIFEIPVAIWIGIFILYWFLKAWRLCNLIVPCLFLTAAMQIHNAYTTRSFSFKRENQKRPTQDPTNAISTNLKYRILILAMEN